MKDHWVKIHPKSFVLQVFVVVVPSMIPLGQSPTLIRRHQLFKGPFGGFPEMSADPVAECFKTGRSSSPSVNEREWERPFWKWPLVKTPLLEWSLPSEGIYNFSLDHFKILAGDFLNEKCLFGTIRSYKYHQDESQ